MSLIGDKNSNMTLEPHASDVPPCYTLANLGQHPWKAPIYNMALEFRLLLKA
ncbi:hypothetical protein HanXRQr2_Chr06g0263551 [Helianthus annuus]|uniref:Uncharacterized protein n=1 Tax=Helianthus annuus TaxID=4232 RepID=A0A251TVP9_HELAN|nr:hypothetical protein HanXRQr2_Chr06g0263551 [Helianthus annuus]